MTVHDHVSGHRFGLLADTHDNLVDWPTAVAEIRSVLDGVEGLIHCGDLCTHQALETLSAIAPVWAVRSADDAPPMAPALVDGPRILEVGGLRIGVAANLPDEIRGRPGDLFGQPVDVCVFGGTHAAETWTQDGVLFVNPGSPTLADRRTVAILSLAHGSPRAEIVPLT